MNRISNQSRALATFVALTGAVMMAASSGCSTKQEKEAGKECVDPPEAAAEKTRKSVKVERFGLGRAGDEDKESRDWCRACVMSQVGYASCQRVFADKPDESRGSLKARAREKACIDAKFPADACPDKALISNVCKGDPLPPGTPDQGTALQNLYKALSSGKQEPAAASTDEQPAPPTTDNGTKTPPKKK